MFAFLATEQKITYKLLMERCKTKIQVYSGRNQNHRPGKFTFSIMQLVHSNGKALTTHKFLLKSRISIKGVFKGNDSFIS